LDLHYYIQFAAAFAFVLALMGLLYFILKKLNEVQSGVKGTNNRIKIMEHRMIDNKTKAVILRCDDKDHLVILGQNGNTVVKTDLKTPKAHKDTNNE
jgi:flagellar protein FliO/FliZ